MSTVECKCRVCKTAFTARVADRKRGWAKCCSKSCAAILKVRQGGPRGPMTHDQKVAAVVRRGGPFFIPDDDGMGGGTFCTPFADDLYECGKEY